MPPATRPAAPAGALAAVPRRADAGAGASGAPGTRPRALTACAAAAPHPCPAGRPARGPARATRARTGASLPAGSGRAGRAAGHGAVTPQRHRPTGPEGHRTTSGEDA